MDLNNKKHLTYEDIRTEIRKEVWGVNDIGLGSLLTMDEINGFVSFLNLNSEQNIFDACCGNGSVTRYIAEKLNCHSCGIDIDRDAIDIAKNIPMTNKKSNIEFHNLDLKMHLPFENVFFDALICLESIMYFSHQERSNIFKEFFRILRPGGKLILTDPCIVSGAISDQELNGRSALGKCFFSPIEFQENLMQEQGFKLSKIRDITNTNIAIMSRKLNLLIGKNRSLLQKFVHTEAFNQENIFYAACDQIYNQSRSLSQYAYYATK